jgi:hypothetical protein
MLDPPGTIALGEVNAMSSIVTASEATPVTESAQSGDGEVTCELPPT